MSLELVDRVGADLGYEQDSEGVWRGPCPTCRGPAYIGRIAVSCSTCDFYTPLEAMLSKLGRKMPALRRRREAPTDGTSELGGWVRVPRALWMRFGADVAGKPCSPREAVVDLLMRAAWKDHPDRRKGEILTGVRWLAKQWCWSDARVRRFLRQLERTQVIEWKRGTRQGEPSRIRVVSDAPMAPPSRPASATQLPARNDATSAGSATHLGDSPPRLADDSPMKMEDTSLSEGRLANVRARARAGDGTGGSEIEGEGDEGKKNGAVARSVATAAPDLWDGTPEPTPDDVAGGQPENAVYTGPRCDMCGTEIGPTATRCARCRYGTPRLVR